MLYVSFTDSKYFCGTGKELWAWISYEWSWQCRDQLTNAKVKFFEFPKLLLDKDFLADPVLGESVGKLQISSFVPLTVSWRLLKLALAVSNLKIRNTCDYFSFWQHLYLKSKIDFLFKLLIQLRKTWSWFPSLWKLIPKSLKIDSQVSVSWLPSIWRFIISCSSVLFLRFVHLHRL